MKKYCSFINHYQPIQWLLTHSTHLSQHLCICVHIVCFVCCFYHSIISTAYHLLSGSRAARLLLNWLIDDWEPALGLLSRVKYRSPMVSLRADQKMEQYLELFTSEATTTRQQHLVCKICNKIVTKGPEDLSWPSYHGHNTLYRNLTLLKIKEDPISK